MLVVELVLEPGSSVREVHHVRRGVCQQKRQRAGEERDVRAYVRVEGVVEGRHRGDQPEHLHHLGPGQVRVEDGVHGAQLLLKVPRHERQHRAASVRVIRVQQRDPAAVISHRATNAELVGEHPNALLLPVRRRVVKRGLAVVVALLDARGVVLGEEAQGGVRARLRGVMRGGGSRLFVRQRNRRAHVEAVTPDSPALRAPQQRRNASLVPDARSRREHQRGDRRLIRDRRGGPVEVKRPVRQQRERPE